MSARRKKAINVSVDPILLTEARRLGINISNVLEVRLREIVGTAEAKAWREENRAAISL